MSYSHADRAWADRVRLHLAVLQRLGLVDVWSDQRIRIGSKWETAIDRALGEAKIAVLIVTPNFHASDFIWDKEMPKIEAHMKEGLIVYPLIARPCAWQLEPSLARLQAWPGDDRALSEGNESDIDFDLSRFVYELAKELLVALPAETASVLATTEWPQGRSTGIPAKAEPVEVWEGAYDPDRQVRLTITRDSSNRIQGQLEYKDEDTITLVTGETLTQWNPADKPWSEVCDRGNSRRSSAAITFREVEYQKHGRSIEFGGEYHVLQTGNRLAGAWFKNGQKFGQIALVKQNR
ncbi:MAG TPA: toll/interleukin-1 receptor domain-containing protein [Thermoanaerobaculia bacterium]|nr:toll/interleukin-1 receptor domain-containing protein [Thermoanaerobaculia bacterium]